MRLKPRLYYVAARDFEWARARAATLRRAPRRPWAGVRILGYHRISTDRDVLAVHPNRFRRQMEQLLERGLRPVSLQSALELLGSGEQLGRVFAVTFDDGYRDVVENAVPLLRELGIPSTIFVSTDVAGGRASYSWYRRPPATLTWANLRELADDELVDVEAHGRTHRALPLLSEREARDEIFGSKAEIERRLGSTVSMFCYPAGLYGARERRLVREAGYLGGLTTDPGVNTSATPRETLARTMISWGDRDHLFAAKIDGLLDQRSSLGSWLHARRSRPGPRADELPGRGEAAGS